MSLTLYLTIIPLYVLNITLKYSLIFSVIDLKDTFKTLYIVCAVFIRNRVNDTTSSNQLTKE